MTSHGSIHFCNADTIAVWDTIAELNEVASRGVLSSSGKSAQLKRLRHQLDETLKRKAPFTELLERPPAAGDYTLLPIQRLSAVVCALRVYVALFESQHTRSRLVWQTIEEFWPHVCIWIGFLHIRPNYESVKHIITLFDDVRQNLAHAGLVALLLAQPHMIVLLTDVWLHMFRYLSAFEITIHQAMVPTAKAIAAIYSELDNADVSAIVEREVLRAVGNNAHKLFRHIARLMHVLSKLPVEQDDGALLATLEIASFFIAEDHNPLLRPSVVPRATICAVVELVKQYAGRVLEIMAQSACFFLVQTWTISTDRRPLLWALRAGLIPHMLRMEQEELRKADATELLKELWTNMAHRRVLRVFWQTYQRDKEAIEKAPWQPKIFKKILRRAKMNYAVLESLEEKWLSDMGHCHNLECPFPIPNMLQCPCKRAYYCSKECQKAHWNAEHRHQCHMWCWSLLENTKEPLPYPLYDQRDIDYLTLITKEYTDHHLDDVFEEAKKIGPANLGRTYTLTVGWASDPTHWVIASDRFFRERMVLIQVAVKMGNELTLVTLPSVTLTLENPEDSDSGTEEGSGVGEGECEGSEEEDESEDEDEVEEEDQNVAVAHRAGDRVEESMEADGILSL